MDRCYAVLFEMELIATNPDRARSPLDHALRGFVDLSSRRAAITHRIRTSPGDAAHGLDIVVRRALNGGAHAMDAAVALASALVALRLEGDHASIGLLRDRAEQQGLSMIATLLVDAPPHRALSQHGRLREVCIPERAAFRCWPVERDPQLTFACRWRMLHSHLDVLIAHPSPIFIGRLLREKWIRPRDVLSIAARRPSTPAIAIEIARSDRWLQRLEVREALVQNPFTPTSLVTSLLPSVRFNVLRHLRDAGDVHPVIATAACALIEAVRG